LPAERRGEMAKAKQKSDVEVPSYSSWNEVDRAVRKYGEFEMKLDEIKNKYDRDKNGLKMLMAARSKVVVDQQKALLSGMEKFVSGHRAEMRAKTKTLTFGKVGFRLHTTIKLKAKFTKEKVVNLLKAKKMEWCIRTKTTEEPDKEKLKSYAIDVLSKVGVKKNVKDRFFCDPDLIKIDRLKEAL